MEVDDGSSFDLARNRASFSMTSVARSPGVRQQQSLVPFELGEDLAAGAAGGCDDGGVVRLDTEWDVMRRTRNVRAAWTMRLAPVDVSVG